MSAARGAPTVSVYVLTSLRPFATGSASSMRRPSTSHGALVRSCSTPEVPFGRLHRRMSQTKLDLLKRRLALVGELCICAAKVMRVHGQPQLARILIHSIVDGLRAHAAPPTRPPLFTGRNSGPSVMRGGTKPCVDSSLGPRRHRHTAHLAALALEVDNYPPALSLL